MKKKLIFNSLISTGTFKEFTDKIFELSETKSSSYVCFANAHMCNFCVNLESRAGHLHLPMRLSQIRQLGRVVREGTENDVFLVKVGPYPVLVQAKILSQQDCWWCTFTLDWMDVCMTKLTS